MLITTALRKDDRLVVLLEENLANGELRYTGGGQFAGTLHTAVDLTGDGSDTAPAEAIVESRDDGLPEFLRLHAGRFKYDAPVLLAFNKDRVHATLNGRLVDIEVAGDAVVLETTDEDGRLYFDTENCHWVAIFEVTS